MGGLFIKQIDGLHSICRLTSTGTFTLLLTHIKTYASQAAMSTKTQIVTLRYTTPKVHRDINAHI